MLSLVLSPLRVKTVFGVLQIQIAYIPQTQMLQQRHELKAVQIQVMSQWRSLDVSEARLFGLELLQT